MPSLLICCKCDNAFIVDCVVNVMMPSLLICCKCDSAFIVDCVVNVTVPSLLICCKCDSAFIVDCVVNVMMPSLLTCCKCDSAFIVDVLTGPPVLPPKRDRVTALSPLPSSASNKMPRCEWALLSSSPNYTILGWKAENSIIQGFNPNPNPNSYRSVISH